MPSAPKKTSKKTTLTPEEHALVLQTRREVIEKRLLRLQAKIDKDRALLQKYTPQAEWSCGSDEHSCE
jgi:hypothetical protein